MEDFGADAIDLNRKGEVKAVGADTPISYRWEGEDFYIQPLAVTP